MHTINVPEPVGVPRIIIIGGGFAGLLLARKLSRLDYQIVLIDKNNYHQFQPLFYQVAMAGLEPSSIAFPLRKVFQKKDNVFLRVTAAKAIDLHRKEVITELGAVSYDYLVIATGADTNFFGNQQIMEKAIPMKSVSEALYLRNAILDDYEKAITIADYEERQGLIDIVIVGGGPTGVEVAGSLAEMKKNILPKDYGEINADEVDIYLIEGADRVLPAMSEEASIAAERFLEDLGVIVKTGIMVEQYDGRFAYLSNHEQIRTNKLIWAAGIKGNLLQGLSSDIVRKGGRIAVDSYNRLQDQEAVFAIGDIAYMESDPNFPNGHPQVAPVAMQQATHLYKNLKSLLKEKDMVPFEYQDKGSMATIGRSKAVVDLPKIKFKGFFAWIIWMVVHLFQLIGVKNKLFVFINWVWSYVLYDQSLRLIIRPRIKPYQPLQQQEEVGENDSKE